MKTFVAGLWMALLLMGTAACEDSSGDKDTSTDFDVTPDPSPDDAVGDTPSDPVPDEAVSDPPSDPVPDEAPVDVPVEEVPPDPDMGREVSIIFLHHSTGGVIWEGGVPGWVSDYNTANDKAYTIEEVAYPSDAGYGWANYPYDYWNIWINHAGPEPYLDEPTLEMLTPDYGVIVFKHCFPVSGIEEDTGSPDIASDVKSIENYTLQYEALKEKLHTFPDNRFIVWTGAALTAASTSSEQAARARQFFEWVKNDWDEAGDNIFVWDFFELETEGGDVLLDENAAAPDDSHPSGEFAAFAAPLFGQRLVNVIQGLGDSTSLTGQ
jgi:hypothetical protein